MDVLDTGVIQGWAVGQLSDILIFSTIVDFNMVMGSELTLGGNWMAVSEKDFLNVILHGEATGLLLVLTIHIDYRKFGSGTIFSDVIMFLEDITKVMGVVFTKVFKNKVIYDETEIDRAPFMVPESRGGERLVVARKIEALGEEVIGKLAGLRKAVDAFAYLEVYPPFT